MSHVNSYKLYKSFTSLLLLSLTSLMLASCLHDPTETIAQFPLSTNLRIYQHKDSIVYTVQATAKLIEEDPSTPGQILIATQLTEAVTGNLLYLDINGDIIIAETIGAITTYTDKAGNELTADQVVGLRPLLNCNSNELDAENAIGIPCIEKLFLAGTLSVDWLKVPDLIEPLSGLALSVMEETSKLELKPADENYNEISATPRVNVSNTRYISQTTEGDNKGELFVHAYATKPATTEYDWVSVEDENQNKVIGKVISDPSPIVGTGTSVNIQHDVEAGCAGTCNLVASANKNMTYQTGAETRTLGTLGTFSTQVIILSGGVSRSTSTPGAVDLGYDIFSNCAFDIPGATFVRTNVNYTGSLAMFSDVGAVEIINNCSANYDITLASQTSAVPVATSIFFTAVMSSTNIDY